MASIISYSLGVTPAVKTAITLAADAFVVSIANTHSGVSVPASNLALLKEAVAVTLSGQDIFIVKTDNDIAILNADDPTLEYSSTGDLRIVSTVAGADDKLIGKSYVMPLSNLSTADWAAVMAFMATPAL